MVGPLILLAASVATPPPSVSAAREAVAGFRPSSSVTARATASVRIVSGARFGAGQNQETAGSQRRKIVLSDAQGSTHEAELLEFQ